MKSPIFFVYCGYDCGKLIHADKRRNVVKKARKKTTEGIVSICCFKMFGARPSEHLNNIQCVTLSGEAE